MRKSDSTSKKVASSASKVLRSKTATKAEKSVAASALAQKGSDEQTSAKIAKAAAKILKSKTASKEAKSAAASALTQKTGVLAAFVPDHPEVLALKARIAELEAMLKQKVELLNFIWQQAGVQEGETVNGFQVVERLRARKDH